MKKIATVALLPVIALVSCGKEQAPVENQAEVSLKDNKIEAEVTTSPVEETKKDTEVATPALNENIVATLSGETASGTTSTDETVSNDSLSTGETGKKDFSFTYDLYGKDVGVKGVFTLDKGVIKAVSFEGTDFAVGQAPLKNFTDTVSTKIIGKELKGLKIDSVSGASLSSAAFNLYVGSL